MDLGLAGKRAVVTGATRGLGLAVAQALRAEGAEVLRVARGGAGEGAFAADLTEEAGAQAVAAEVARRWPDGLDILVCNVGSGRSVPPGTETAAEWRRVLDLNLFTAIHAIEALRGQLRTGGAIVCISSIAARRAIGAPVTYSAAKAALESLVANLARPLAADGVRIVGVAPGNMLFPGSVWETKLAEDTAAVEVMLARDVPMKRLGTAAEVADVVAFLASPRAGFVTGTVVTADGGQAA